MATLSYVVSCALTSFDVLQEKISSKKARVGIVGLGYVGLPLAVELAQAGFEVTGVDLSDAKTCRLMAGKSYIADVPTKTVADLVNKGKLHATTDFSAVSDL